MTMLIDIEKEKGMPFFTLCRSESNTASDFFDFVKAALQAGSLKNGDHFVVDNASVHSGTDVFFQLEATLQSAGVNLAYLPAYSPELNPCELVFGYIKHRLRSSRNLAIPFWQDLAEGLESVTPLHLISWYKKCTSLKNLKKAFFNP
jgi:transposase